MFLDLSSELLSIGYRIRFRPSGNSMRPTIRDGEVVTVEPIEACEVRCGDIILYRDGSRVIAHRVVRIEAEGIFILRGDALRNTDQPVRAEQVMGRVSAVLRSGRNVRVAGRGNSVRLTAYRFAARLKASVRARINLSGFTLPVSALGEADAIRDAPRCGGRESG